MKSFLIYFVIIFVSIFETISISLNKQQAEKIYELEERVCHLEEVVSMWFYGPSFIIEDNNKSVNFDNYDPEN